jgi:L-alanine-DL-glutamate epimerase-like enolase superfamily enzyme
MPLWDSLADLTVRVDDYALERRELQVSDEFTRVTTTIVLRGDGETGAGEDVTYIAEEHDHVPSEVMLAGTWTLDDYSGALDDLEVGGGDYRRWAFESAALDLALRQTGRSLAEVVGRPYRPVRFVVSTRSVIEDAWLEGEAREALRGAEERLSFDAPIHSLDDLDDLAVEPRWLNVKPSRFGTLRGLLECIEACEERGITMYGGGQFELGPGRRQIQRLASLFYADAPNDVAPSVYNEGPPKPGMPASPLPAPDGVGF